MPTKQDLERCLTAAIIRPTTTIHYTGELVPIVPHLEFQEVEELLTARSSEFTNFIVPPTRVRGAEHVFTLSPRANDDTRQLTYAYCYRRRESYACCPAGTPVGHRQREFDYRERVSNYSETSWGESLLWDRASQIVEFEVVDPTCTSNGGGLFPVATVTAALAAVLVGQTEYADDDDEFAPDCPFVEAMTHSIINYSSDAAVQMELRGDHMPAKVFNCAFCGGGMGATGCSFCECSIKTPTTMQSRIAWSHPLPLDIAEESRVEFKTPPIQAIKREYQLWATKDYVPPQLTIQPRRQRSVVLREDE